MQFGLQINPYYPDPTGNPWPAVEKVARAVDESGFDSLWLYDHLLYEGGYSGHPFSEPVMECFTTLGAIAAVTRRVRLGQLVLGVPYRNPALTAKMATTLDMISRGRSILGLGAGWHEREYEAYGYGTFEEVPVRMKRLEEAIRVVLALWTERPASFEGQYYRLDDVKENPAPVQKPHPPLLVGGSGEKVTLRLVARYAQFCNVSGDPETVRHRLGVLREHCDRIGRPYDEVTRSIYTTVVVGRDEAEVTAKRERLSDYVPRGGALIGTPAQLIAAFRDYARAGCQYVIFRMPDWNDVEPVRVFAEQVIPGLADE
ncbi:MAG TPA: LLM class F420-dependent oxidoreductase [Chloroflexota bacterium]|jgi:F420-dependent oxidoreductase-like protein|nr:LLM class F420-dependent oxidoreductase [Chloroflexota bacterium]